MEATTQVNVDKIIAQVGAEAFAKDPIKYLKQNGVSDEVLNDMDAFNTYLSAPISRGGALPYASVKTSPWSLTIILNNDATQDIINNSPRVGALATGLASAGPAVVLAPFVAAAFAACTQKVKSVDKGKGVKLSIPWILMPTMVGAAPLIGLIMAGLKSN